MHPDTFVYKNTSTYPFTPSPPPTKTACKPCLQLPSVSTANATFFCLRTDLIHPETVIFDGSAGLGWARSCRIVGGSLNEVGPELQLDASRRRIM